MGHRPVEWPLAAADGTDNEDLELYLSGLARYREWYLAERPADYLARLERLLESLAGDLRELERLRDALAVIVEAFEDMMPGYGEAWLAYGRLFHALVTVVDGTKWVVAREFPDGEKLQSFSEAFRLLVEAEVLPREDLAAYESLGRLRNRLAHAWESQPSATEMLRSLDEALPPIKDFLFRLRLRYADPKALREALGFRDGDYVLVFPQGEGMRIEKAASQRGGRAGEGGRPVELAP